MNEATAFSPCHITGFFSICDQVADPLHTGSLGAGVALSQGIETTVRIEEADKNSVTVAINGVPQKRAFVSEYVAHSLLSRRNSDRKLGLKIDHCVQMPVGAGFGTSGAAALGLSLALAQIIDPEVTRIEAAQVAHVAEVECKTGLGTVIAEAYGGLEMRTKAGAPGIGKVRRIPVPRSSVIACLAFGPLPTSKFLSDHMTRKRVNELGSKFTEELKKESEPSNFLKLSRRFAEHVGLISERMRKVLVATDREGFVCSMPMFGESIFTLTDRESLQDLLDLFDKNSMGGKIIASNIDFEGARLLN